jgi:glycerate dehydrogenase
MRRIVVLDGHTVNPGDNSWAPLEALGSLVVYERTSPENVVERAQGASVILTNKTRIDAEAIAALPGLEGILVLATGYNVVDVGAARARQIPVCNVPSYSTASVVEHTFALLFELCRHVGIHDQAVQAGSWQRSPDFCFWLTPQLELAGRTLGIVGYGEIGSRVARVALALGMRVLSTPSRRAPEAGVVAVELESMLPLVDVLSLHCPLTDETRELVRWERLARMKPSAFVINTARGGLINEADLARALRKGVIAAAALDVLGSEPPRPDNPLLEAPNCCITPHIAWTSLEARRRVIEVSADNARALFSGRPIHVVDA